MKVIDSTSGGVRMAAMPGQFMFIFWFCTVCAAGVAVLLPLMRRWASGVS